MFIDLNIIFNAQENIKSLLYTALSAGYNIVAVSKELEKDELKEETKFNDIKKFKVVNCFAYYDDDKKLDIYKEDNINNYFFDEYDNTCMIDSYLSKINNLIKENFILINKSNTFSIKNICDDFILSDKNEITQDDYKMLYNYLQDNKNEKFFLNYKGSTNKNMSNFTVSNIYTNNNNNNYNNNNNNNNNVQIPRFILSKNTNTYVLKRLNIKFENFVATPNFNNIINNSNFDIIAVMISNIESMYIIINHQIDIITLDPMKKFSHIKRTIIQTAIDRGMYFEICSPNSKYFSKYSPQFYIHNLTTLLSVVPHNRIIISSGSSKNEEIIEPLDMFRLFFNFGTFSYEDFIRCMTTVPLACIQRASVRKSQNTAVFGK
ncbi:ribonuclease P/MRP protein subunit RPP1, putative [Hepatocystis sp. ex Piliocolobus tephrosceles]|nr:ribonuclease P/MRP protein subunit RPP1, putative [Hepatocystis sp. ex Piliocolobus tephrosceles]